MEIAKSGSMCTTTSSPALAAAATGVRDLGRDPGDRGQPPVSVDIIEGITEGTSESSFTCRNTWLSYTMGARYTEAARPRWHCYTRMAASPVCVAYSLLDPHGLSGKSASSEPVHIANPALGGSTGTSHRASGSQCVGNAVRSWGHYCEVNGLRTPSDATRPVVVTGRPPLLSTYLASDILSGRRSRGPRGPLERV